MSGRDGGKGGGRGGKRAAPAMQLLTGGRLVLPDAVVDGAALLVDGGRIKAITRPAEVAADVPRVELHGAYLAPGLVDVHAHGAVGHLFNEATEASWDAILRAHAEHGTTSMLPTTLTAPLDELLRVLAYARSRFHGGCPDAAQVLGVHLEGPFFARAQAGAQNPEHVIDPTPARVDRLLAFGDVLRMVSYAPERPGALELTRRLVASGIVAAAGHSEAEDHHLAAAADQGLSHVIHVFSGQSTTVRRGPYRHPGLLEATLASDGLTVEMIADGHHLPGTLMRLAHRCLGPERLCLVSDATHGAGLPQGTPLDLAGVAAMVGPWPAEPAKAGRLAGTTTRPSEGPRSAVRSPTVGMLTDGSAFAGSTTFLGQMLSVVRGELGLGVAEVVRMASLTPARAVGMGDRKGSLEAGKDADLIVLDEGLRCTRRMIAGRWTPAKKQRGTTT